jgi:hypothetical protein
MEPGLHVVRGGQGRARQLALRALDVEGEQGRAAAALEPCRRLALVGDVAVEAGAEEGPEARAREREGALTGAQRKFSTNITSLPRTAST